MNSDILTIANCIAIVASILGFIMVLWELGDESPLTPEARRNRVKLFTGIAVISVVLLVFVSFRLKHNIDTLEQTGSLQNYGGEEIDIKYPISYFTIPHLEFIPLESASNFPPIIIEQRNDGFKIRTQNDYSRFYDWKATGRR